MAESEGGRAGRRSRAPWLRPESSLQSRMMLAFVTVALAAVGLVTAAALVGTNRGLTAQKDSDRAEVATRVAELTAQAYDQAGSWSSIDLGRANSVAEAAGARLMVHDVHGELLPITPSVVGPGPGSRESPTTTATPTGSPTATRTSDAATAPTPSPSLSAGPGPGSGQGQGRGQGQGQGRGTGAQATSAPSSTPTAGSTRGLGLGARLGGVSAEIVLNHEVIGTVTLIFGTQTALTGRPVAWAWVGAAAVAALVLALAAAWYLTTQLTRPVAALTAAARAFAAGDRGARSEVRGRSELGLLGMAFDEAASQVQRSEQARQRMAADVAHELRTPLAALQASLEELRDGLVPADTEALARLHDQSLRLGRVVGDLAELSAAEAAAISLHRQHTDLAEIADTELTANEPRLRAAGLSVSRELVQGTWVEADPERIHQVIGNLLQNCARHCRPGDHVTVTVSPAPIVPGTAPAVRLTVADTGPGIPPADLPQVFTRFWRGSRSEVAGGSGLGMAIVAGLVQAHHGTCTVDSDGERGTIVAVTLPRVFPQPAPNFTAE